MTAMQEKLNTDDKRLRRKLQSLSRVAAGESEKDSVPAETDPLVFALLLLAKSYRLPFVESSLEAAPSLNDSPAVQGAETSTPAGADSVERLRVIAARNRWRVRKISLAKGFHTWTSAPLLAFMDDELIPTAVVLRGRSSYFYNHETGRAEALTEAQAARFALFAYRFYEPLPEKPLSWADVIRFMAGDSKYAVACLFVSGAAAGLLGLVQPLAVEYVSGSIIPSASLSELWQLLAFLLALTLSGVLLELVPNLFLLGFGLQRFERFAAAVFDRLLKIPVDFFRGYSAGDMSSRISRLLEAQQTLLEVAVGQLTKSAFSLLSLVMLLYYSWRLTLAGLVLTLLYCGALLLVLRSSSSALADRAEAGGRMAGMLKQFFEGIAKIRGNDAATRVMIRYLDDFTPAVRASWIVMTNSGRLNILSSLFPAIVSMLFFWMVGGSGAGSMSVPQYLAFLAAFGAFQGGVIGLFGGVWKLYEARPDLERIKPIMAARLETPWGQADPGRLDGRVEISGATFRYAKDQRPVLDSVSLKAAPGEFIAVVGPSGSGKSTLVRLLLGFEQPEKGAVYYSNRDLSGLDVGAVRRQLGVIMQNGKPMPGTILSNIISGTEFTVDDAEKSIRMACLDKDIEAMPMGMFTVVRDGLLSGGQQQRLMIARALVGNPAVLIMDESTSALDNVTQDVVRKNVEGLKATRIVIAHRLSTIIKADRIYVLEAGRIVQEGTFAELMSEEGLFKELTRHQLL